MVVVTLSGPASALDRRLRLGLPRRPRRSTSRPSLRLVARGARRSAHRRPRHAGDDPRRPVLGDGICWVVHGLVLKAQFTETSLGRLRRHRDRRRPRRLRLRHPRAQLGLKIACVEGRETLGGTCLNVGCIPSKALLHASELYHEAHDNLRQDGPDGGEAPRSTCRRCWPTRTTVDPNTKGIEFLFKKNKIDWLKGWGSIPAPGEVTVGDTAHKAKAIVIATGSEVSTLPGVTIDEKTVVTSTGALALPEIPKRLAVIGAGVIGLELGSVYARLGSEVTVLEYLDQITPGMDLEVCKAFQQQLAKQGLTFVLGAAVQAVEPGDDGVHVTHKLRKDDSEASLDADVVLVATGRRPYVEGLGLDAARRRAHRARPDRDRRPLAHQRPRHLRHRRRQRRPDARPQGRGRGHGRGRDPRRPARPRELRRDPRRDLHLPRGRHRRPDRGGAQGRGPRLQGRQVPLHGQRPRQGRTSWATAS